MLLRLHVRNTPCHCCGAAHWLLRAGPLHWLYYWTVNAHQTLSWKAVPLLFYLAHKKVRAVEKSISTKDYFTMLERLIPTGLVDAIDIELFFDQDRMLKTIEFAKVHGVTIVMSNHDFHGTPSHEVIVNRPSFKWKNSWRMYQRWLLCLIQLGMY